MSASTKPKAVEGILLDREGKPIVGTARKTSHSVAQALKLLLPLGLIILAGLPILIFVGFSVFTLLILAFLLGGGVRRGHARARGH